MACLDMQRVDTTDFAWSLTVDSFIRVSESANAMRTAWKQDGCQQRSHREYSPKENEAPRTSKSR